MKKSQHLLLKGILSLIGVGIFSTLFSSCGGVKSEYVAPSIILPPDVKTISVRHFENETSVAEVGQKLWLAVTDEFIRDGRIAYNDDEAKSVSVEQKPKGTGK